MEVVVAATIMVLIGVISTQAFAFANRQAAISRLGVNARAIVERNIARVLNVPFTSTQVPTILGVTSASGTVFDEDGNGDNVVSLVVQDTSGATIIYGTLTRTVLAITNTENADIRQVTIRIDYAFRGKPYNYQLTTVRART